MNVIEKKKKKKKLEEDDEVELEIEIDDEDRKVSKKKKKKVEIDEDEGEEEVKKKKKKPKEEVEIEVLEEEEEEEWKPRKKSRNTNIILQFNFEIGDVIIDEDINKLLKMPKFDSASPQKLSDIMAESPALYARWTVLYNQACYEYEQSKIDYDVWFSNVFEDVRTELLQEGRVTESKIQHSVEQLPKYTTKNKEVSHLKRTMNNVKAISVALVSRGDKATTMAYVIKKEMGMNQDEKIYSRDSI